MSMKLYQNKCLLLAVQTSKTLKNLFLKGLKSVYGIQEKITMERVY